MQELIGPCVSCRKNVYCENGFLNGIHLDGLLYCFECGDVEQNNDRENE